MAERTFDMHKAATWYAKRGIAVFPLHEPLLAEGIFLFGCSCEEWRRSDDCLAKTPHRHLGPDESCATPGKCPRVAWKTKSTTELRQIAAWWRWWPDAGIGIDCGKSGLTVLDFDVNKPGYAGNELYERLAAEYPTVEVITGSGGRHLLYKAPADVRITNSAAGLPAHVDVRSNGGYIVAPPSVHHSGRRYQYEQGKSPADMAPVALPQFLVDLLGAPKHRPQAAQRPIHHAPAGDRAADIAGLVGRLAPWRADTYHEWIQTGLAIKGALGEQGYELWRDFSARSTKFDPDACERKWATFTADGGFGSGSLAFWAAQDGALN